jgi:hypothetical protein
MLDRDNGAGQLRYFGGWISERRRAMDPKHSDETMDMLDAIIHVYTPAFQVMQAAVAQRWSFAIGHFPSEIRSDSEPPASVDKRSEVIPIDGLLGLYDPASLQITVFQKGIERVSEILGVRASDLDIIVTLHEWAHGLIHLGLTEQERLKVIMEPSSWDTHLATTSAWFRELDPILHERLAQLLTYHGLKDLSGQRTNPKAVPVLERISIAFEQLMRRQSPEYQIQAYLGIPRSRIIESLSLLKDRTLVGASAWDTVIRW